MQFTQVMEKAPKGESNKCSKGERRFDLSLPVIVTGTDAIGNDFEESTELSSISAAEAFFWLKKPVLIGSRISLTLNVPKTLILENCLNLIVSGEVSFASMDKKKKGKQLVSIQLNRIYKINPIYSKK